MQTQAAEALIHSAAAAIVGFDLDGRVILWNPGAERTFGWAAHEVLGCFNPLEPESGRARFLEFVRGTRSDVSWADVELTRRDRNGARHVLGASSTPLRDPDGNALGVVTILIDITDRHDAERALREEEERIRSIVENALDAVVSMDAEGRIIGWNGNAERTFGWAEAEALGRNLAETLIPARARAAHTAGVRRFIETGESGMLNRRIEAAALRRDATEFPVELAISPARESGRPVFNAFVRDISDRKAGEQALRASEEQFRTLIANIPGAVYRCRADADWTMEYVSDDITEITGYPASDFLGNAIRSYASVLWEPDLAAVIAAIESSIVEKSPFIAEYRIVRADGGIRWVYEKGQVIVDGAGAPLWIDGAIFDVTDRHRAEEERERLLLAERTARAEAELAGAQLEEQNEQLRALDRLKDEFVALVSHELRTPLTSILGYLDLVCDDEEDVLSSDHRRFLGIVRRNSERLLNLVGDLLFVAQVDAGKLSLDVGPADLAAIAAECLETNRPKALEKSIELTLRAGASSSIEGDPGRLAQLLDNLVANAVKFTPVGGRVDVAVAVDDRCATVTVADTGIGIPEAEQHRLFERFFRAEGATRLAIQGTGLGLTISKAIVEAHRGTITLTSREGQGTTFRVELPVAAQIAAAA